MVHTNALASWSLSASPSSGGSTTGATYRDIIMAFVLCIQITSVVLLLPVSCYVNIHVEPFHMETSQGGNVIICNSDLHP